MRRVLPLIAYAIKTSPTWTRENNELSHQPSNELRVASCYAGNKVEGGEGEADEGPRKGLRCSLRVCFPCHPF